jgi:glucose/arabinose dehydrogenase
MILRTAAALTILALSCSAADAVKLTRVYPNMTLDKPTSVVVPPDGTGRMFLVQQRGLILQLPKDDAAKEGKVFLDFTQKGMEAKDGKFEEGLLGLAFHPEFKTNGKFYIAYSMQDMKRTVYAEMKVSATDPDVADISTERVLLEIPLPYWNHHCGNIAFGPDGMLYIPVGDGGGKPGGDPLRHVQNLFSMNGKVLRIDVNRTQGSRQYGIPADNPFVGKEAAREEVYAYGFRNPWGISFDQEGNFWLADVGQMLWEEVNLVEKGGNYGWSWREGKAEYADRVAAGEKQPEGTAWVDPVHVYDHSQGISITGGFVYRGSKLSNFKGAYVYGDWGYGNIWMLRYDKAAKAVKSNDLILEKKFDAKGKGLVRPSAFCEDANNEVLVLDWNGMIYRLDPV